MSGSARELMVASQGLCGVETYNANRYAEEAGLVFDKDAEYGGAFDRQPGESPIDRMHNFFVWPAPQWAKKQHVNNLLAIAALSVAIHDGETEWILERDARFIVAQFTETYFADIAALMTAQQAKDMVAWF